MQIDTALQGVLQVHRESSSAPTTTSGLAASAFLAARASLLSCRRAHISTTVTAQQSPQMLVIVRNMPSSLRAQALPESLFDARDLHTPLGSDFYFSASISAPPTKEKAGKGIVQ